jgi:hypothetical protein
VDDGVPNLTVNATATQVIVWNAPSVLVWKSPAPTITCTPEARADTLSVALSAGQYCASVAKFASGVVSISGSGYESLS